jgi:4-hydroxybenzoyl-CoA thioesterase
MTTYRTKFKVRFGDIDQAGIVYYPRILHYFHVAMEEFFSHELAIDYPTVVLQHHVGLPTVHLETDFKKPLRYGDVFEVEVRVLSIGKTSIKFGYTAYYENQDVVVLEGHNVTVCVEIPATKKLEIPGWLREKLEAYQKRSTMDSLTATP